MHPSSVSELASPVPLTVPVHSILLHSSTTHYYGRLQMVIIVMYSLQIDLLINKNGLDCQNAIKNSERNSQNIDFQYIHIKFHRHLNSKESSTYLLPSARVGKILCMECPCICSRAVFTWNNPTDRQSQQARRSSLIKTTPFSPQSNAKYSPIRGLPEQTHIHYIARTVSFNVHPSIHPLPPPLRSTETVQVSLLSSFIRLHPRHHHYLLQIAVDRVQSTRVPSEFTRLLVPDCSLIAKSRRVPWHEC